MAAEEFELSRNIAIGQYLPTGSVVHQLDPRTKLVAAFCLMMSLSSVSSLVGSLLVVFLLLLIARLARISIKFILRGLLPALTALTFLFLIQFWFQGWREPAERIYFEWEFLRVTRVSVYLIALGVVRVVGFLFLFSLLTMTTTATNLTQGLVILLSPLQRVGLPVQEIGLVNMISIRFVPTLVGELERVMKAQASRGAETGTFRSWRPDKIARARLPLIVPLFLNALKRADDLVMAMEARGYAAGVRRTRYAQFYLQPLDWLVMVGMAFFCWLVWWFPWTPLYVWIPGL